VKIVNVKQKNRRTTKCIISLIDDVGNNMELELSMDLVVREQLNKNMEINDMLYEQLISEQRSIDAKQIAFNYISYKKRTKKQVIDKLKQKGFTENEVNLTIEYLDNNNLLDDEKYEKSFVKDILLTKKIGKNKVFNILYEKGVDREIIVNTLNKYFPNDSLETAIIVAERKYNLIKNKPIEKIKQSLFNHLLLKGFSFEEAKETINIVITKNLSKK
jgi:regulatory protein